MLHFNFVVWHKELVHQISPRNVVFAILGKVLFVFTLGSLLAGSLGAWENIGKILLFLGTVVMLNSLTGLFLAWHTRKEPKYIDFFLGFLGLFFLLFYAGLQFPGIPWLWTLLVLGIILVLPGLWDIIHQRQRKW